MPVLALGWLVAAPAPGRGEWWLRLLLVGGLVLLAFQLGVWVNTSYYLRYVVLALLPVAAVGSGWRRQRGGEGGSEGRVRLLLQGTGAVLFVAANLLVIGGRRTPAPDRAVELSFPLQAGTYHVLQGGGHPLMNLLHSPVRESRFALDIVGLRPSGNRAGGLLPERLEAYAIYGDTLYSPCEGEVAGARDGNPDNVPPEVDRLVPAGNRLLIACRGVVLTLGHLMRGSVAVSEGDSVAEGEPLGRAGNSGLSREPHLHIQANTSGGRPVPMFFGGRYLSINDTVVGRQAASR